MADPFDEAQTTNRVFETPAGPVVRLNLKPSGGYDAPWAQIQGTLPELAAVLNIDTNDETYRKSPLWVTILRWNDLSFAVQKDYAKKAGAQGKA